MRSRRSGFSIHCVQRNRWQAIARCWCVAEGLCTQRERRQALACLALRPCVSESQRFCMLGEES